MMMSAMRSLSVFSGRWDALNNAARFCMPWDFYALCMQYALYVARTARGCGVRTEVDVIGHGVGAGLRLAAKKQIQFALIVGEDEQRRRLVTVRDLMTGEEKRVSLESFAGQVLG